MNTKLKTTNIAAFTLIEALVTFSVIGILLLVAFGLISGPVLGLFPFGPEKTVTAKVERLYVDYSGGKDSSKSHYMVGTDQGVFEVDNSLWLWIWDADERYSTLKQGETYNLRVKGNKMLNFLFQEYPGVVSIEKAE